MMSAAAIRTGVAWVASILIGALGIYVGDRVASAIDPAWEPLITEPEPEPEPA